MILPEEVYEKLTILIDEIGDVDQTLIRAINELYETLYELPTDSDIESLDSEIETSKELRKVIERLEEKISKVRVSGRPQPSSSDIPSETKVPEIEEIQGTEQAVENNDRPGLDGMLENVVVNSGKTEKETKKKDGN